jgi:hypothetical protein
LGYVKLTESAIDKAFKPLLEDITDIEKQEELISAIDHNISSIRKLHPLLNRLFVATLVSTFASLSDHNNTQSVLGTLYISASEGSKSLVTTNANEFNTSVDEMVNMCKHVAGSNLHSHPHLSRDIILSLKVLVGLKGSVVASANLYSIDNKSPETKEFCDLMFKQWESEIKNLKSMLLNQNMSFKMIELLDGISIFSPNFQ